jgi:hypothetical protein
VPLPSLSTSALAFGGVEVGSTGAVEAVGLKNLGNAPLRVGTRSASGDAVTFPVASDTCSGATLEPGDGCSVGFAFAPVAVGATSATLSLPTNAGAVTVQLGGTGTAPVALFGSSVLDFGGAVIGTETRLEVDLRNDGTAPLLLERLGVDGEAASDFAADASACGRALAPGETCRITVVFSPLELGDRKASLELPGAGDARVALVGYGGERPKSRDAAPAPDETPPPAPAPDSA